MGFFGFASATTLTGEVVLPPSVGLDTVSGKSLEPSGSGGVQLDVTGVQAGGAGSGLVFGAHVIGTGGVEGADGWLTGGVGAIGVLVPLVPHAVAAMSMPRSEIESNEFESVPGRSGVAARTIISTHLGLVQYGRRITTSGKETG